MQVCTERQPAMKHSQKQVPTRRDKRRRIMARIRSLLAFMATLLVVYFTSASLVYCARFQDSNLLIQSPQQMTTAELNRTQPTALAALLRQQQQQHPQASTTTTSRVLAPGEPVTSNKLVSNFNQSLSSVRLRWRQMESSVTNSLAVYAATLKTTLIDLLQNNNNNNNNTQVSLACKSSLLELFEGLSESRLWASQMVDSSARLLPSGLLEGTLTELGNFDECLAISYHSQAAAATAAVVDKSQSKQTTSGAGHLHHQSGQYCSLQIKPALISRPRLHTACRKLPTLSAAAATTTATTTNQTFFRLLSQNSQQFYYAGIRLGLCLPSKCSLLDTQHLLTLFLSKYELVGLVKSCQQQQQPIVSASIKYSSQLADLWDYLIPTQQLNQLDHVQQVVLALFLLLFALTITGTLLDNQRQLRDRAAWRTKVSLTKEQQQQERCQQVAAAAAAAAGRHHRLACQQQYQVYCGGSSSNESILLDQSQVSSPGPQQNPISEHYGSGGGGGGGSSLPAVSPAAGMPQLLPPLVGLNGSIDKVLAANHRLNREHEANSRPTTTTGDANQVPCGPVKVSGSNKSKCAQQPAGDDHDDECCLLRAILICFSVKSNLRTIGKLSSHSTTTTTTMTSSNEALGNVVGASRKRRSSPADDLKAGGHLQHNYHNTNNNDNMADVKVIHGLRTLAMIWIIFGHTIGLVNPEMMNNLFPLANLSCSSRLLQALLNATLAVNTFFMISGLVTVISFARKCKSALALINGPQLNDGHRRHTHDMHGATDNRKGLPSGKSNNNNNNNNNNSRKKRQESSSSSSLSQSSSGCSASDTIEVSSIGSSSASVVTSLGSSASLNRSSNQQHTKTKNGPRGWPADFQPLMWLLMRYLRLTPTYVVVIGCSVLLPGLGSGPFWPESVQPMGAACRLNWIYNLFYVNNFIETDKLCLIHSWYLSNDWQFFLLTLILFAIFYKSKKLVIIAIVSLVCASSAATFAITVENDFPPTIVTTSPAVAERWLFIHSLYYKPWPHLSSYLIGLFVGYLILIRDRIELAQGWRLTCWTLFSLVAVALLNSIYPWNVGLQVDPLITGLHSATFRTLWAACCAWLVFALVTRPKSSLALLLSWHGFQITSRLTYCAYLVHPLIITYHFGALRERIDSSMYGQLHRFMATLMLSYLFALVLSLLAECPSIKLQQLIVGRLLQHNKPKSTNPDIKSRSVHEKNQHKSSDGSNKFGLTRQTDFTWTTNSPNEQPGEAPPSGGGGGISLPPMANGSSQSVRLMMMGEPGGQFGLQDEFNFNVINNYRQLQNSSQPKLATQHTCCSNTPKKTHESTCSSSSPIDEDFQQKLAQAIGRGFKIRSKIVNGTLARQPNEAGGALVSSRRFGHAKRLPATSRANLAPIFAQQQQPAVAMEDEQGRDMPLANNNNCLRRDCTTFVSPNNYNSNQIATPQQELITSSGKQPTDLNEMLPIGKQKLQSRPHNRELNRM